MYCAPRPALRATRTRVLFAAIIMNDQPGSGPDQTTRTIRAAEYARMSTEHQQYSIENQGEAIRQYAERRGMAIVPP
jgi:predicted site-specific integrase-resolvase